MCDIRVSLLLQWEVSLIASACFRDLGLEIHETFKWPINPDLEVFRENYIEKISHPKIFGQ